MARGRLSYPGDSTQKTDIRNKLYRSTNTYWGKHRPPGTIVVMAGHEAKEVSLLRDYLRWPAAQTLFVDIDRRGLLRAQEEWPGVPTYHGYVRDAVEQLNLIAMLNLDLMGKFNDEVEKTLEIAADKIVPRGVVAYTFYRHRDHVTQHSFQKTLFAARQHLDLQNATFEDVRWVGTTARLHRCLQFVNPQLLLAESYASARSGMGLIAITNDPE